MKLGEYHLHFGELDSTNTYAKTHADELPSGAVITADYQTAGKGRLGRRWTNLPGKTLCISFFFRNPSWDISLLPLVSALAVSNAVERLYKTKVEIKWPNDLILQDKKICGILCESILKKDTISVVCGIGINLNQPPEHFKDMALNHAASLYTQLGKTVSAQRVRDELIACMDELLHKWENKGFSPLKEDYLKRLVNLDRHVSVVYQRNSVQGICRGISENGNLLCELEDGTVITVTSGEASVRGLYGYI